MRRLLRDVVIMALLLAWSVSIFIALSYAIHGHVKW